MTAIYNDGNTPFKLMIEITGQLAITIFEDYRCPGRKVPVSFTEMNIKMRRSQDVPVKLLVLYLVLAEPPPLDRKSVV